MIAADIILKNANVITMDPRLPSAEMVAIKGNRILHVGDSGELESVIGTQTKTVDCQGKTLIPGFVDAHCHVLGFIREKLGIHLSPVSVNSIADIKAIIGQWVKTAPPGKWFIGTNYDEFHLSDKRHPTRWDIDEVSPNHPVVLFHRSYHACVLNSLALELVNITGETPEPPDGQIDRDINTGKPNGILFNMMPHIIKRIPPPPETEMTRAINLANREYISYGITSLQDASPSNDLGRWNFFHRLKNNGQLKSRISMMFDANALSQFQQVGLIQGSGDNQLRLGGVKLMLNETAVGLFPSQAEFKQTVFDIHRTGFQLAIHAIEPDAVAAAVSALEHAHYHFPQSGRRHRIEHCSECPPDLSERLSKLQVTVVTQPAFLYYSGDRYLATLPHDRVRWLYRNKSFHDAGLFVAGSSDSPVTPVNPLIGMYAAITRQAKTGEVITPDERISPIQALAMYTINAAYASYEEDLKGSITQSKLADIVLLSDDPLRSPPERIKEIKVEMTIIDGKTVWEA